MYLYHIKMSSWTWAVRIIVGSLRNSAASAPRRGNATRAAHDGVRGPAKSGHPLMQASGRGTRRPAKLAGAATQGKPRASPTSGARWRASGHEGAVARRRSAEGAVARRAEGAVARRRSAARKRPRRALQRNGPEALQRNGPRRRCMRCSAERHLRTAPAQHSSSRRAATPPRNPKSQWNAHKQNSAPPQELQHTFGNATCKKTNWNQTVFPFVRRSIKRTVRFEHRSLHIARTKNESKLFRTMFKTNGTALMTPKYFTHRLWHHATCQRWKEQPRLIVQLRCCSTSGEAFRNTKQTRWQSRHRLQPKLHEAIWYTQKQHTKKRWTNIGYTLVSKLIMEMKHKEIDGTLLSYDAAARTSQHMVLHHSVQICDTYVWMHVHTWVNTNVYMYVFMHVCM